MATVRVDLHEGVQAVFNSRGRSFVNSHEAQGDELRFGFSSLELLLIALGDASLTALAGHPLFADEPLYGATVKVTAEPQSDRALIGGVHWEIELVVENEGVTQHEQELERIVLSAPVCNLLNTERSVRITIGTQRDVALRFLPPLAAESSRSQRVVE